RGRGSDFTFERIYRSNDYRKALAGPGVPVVRDFGVSWTYSYADEYLLKDGTGSDVTANYVNYRGGQSGNVFINTASSVWSAGQDDFVTLRKNSAGDFE